MMVGLMKITEGDIRIVGKSIQTDYSEAIREVGAIVENPEMYPFFNRKKKIWSSLQEWFQAQQKKG